MSAVPRVRHPEYPVYDTYFVSPPDHICISGEGKVSYITNQRRLVDLNCRCICTG